MPEESEEEIIARRIRFPGEDEVLGVAESMLGFSRVKVRCVDGESRMCRIPGRMRNRIWIKEGDVVLVEPWSFQPEKGDIVWRYTTAQANWLKKKGYMEKEEKEF